MFANGAGGAISETSALLGSESVSKERGGKFKKSTLALKASKNERKSRSTKLGMFEGVFLPTSLNVLSILMFLRFGFIIGQMGILGTFFLLVLSYTINVLTTMSISAISTNGTVRGGGAYYMISRSLGPEFGGAIGIIFFIGQILNSSLNVVGFIEPLMVNFGCERGDILSILPVGYFWQLFYSTILLAICTGIALVGSNLVSKTALILFIVLSISTMSIPFSALSVKPFEVPGIPEVIKYSGISFSTIKDNLLPHFTTGAAGSTSTTEKETFRDLFGIFFPATAGILAGASMSGDLKNPSKSIPEGTLKGLLLSFIYYSLVILSMGSAIPRKLLYADIEVIQTVSIYPPIIILGEFSTALFSVIMGVVAAASMLCAIADDRIIPGLGCFSTLGKKPSEKKKASIFSVIITWFIAQVFLFADINKIATFITMAFLMTFIVTNLACFLLRIGSAPNFRPSFRYFNTRTAFTGVLACLVAMFIVDGISATLVICFLMFFIMMIHYLTPPLKFGDISQLLIYHQVRKYLLRLKYNIGVKYWRPQILLLCDDPRTCWNLIGFCNHLKKGGLYILGHVVLLNGDNDKLQSNEMSKEFNINIYKEIKKQKQAWLQLTKISKIKAFVQIALGPSLPWGVRNIYLGSGLGGMRPNITVLGFYDMYRHGMASTLLPSFLDKKKLVELPTDECRKERKVSINQWVQILEDLIIMQATVAVAANFDKLDLPLRDFKQHHFWSQPKLPSSNEKKFLDLYPIQMSSINILDDGQSVLSTNFDTYTLILQLGSILSSVPEWKFNSHVLRVVAFVEREQEVDEERGRLKKLLSELRIQGEIKIVCLDDGSLNSYNFLVKGYSKTLENQAEFDRINFILQKDQWWKNLCEARAALKEFERQKSRKKSSGNKYIEKTPSVFNPLNLGNSPKNSSDVPPMSAGLKNNRRYTISNLHEQGLSLSFNMKSQKTNQFFNYQNPLDDSSSSSSSESETDNGYDSEATDQNYVTAPSVQAAETPKHDKIEENKSPLNTFNLRYGTKNRSNLSIDNMSIRSSRSNLRPNFLSYKIPQSQIKSDENDEPDDNKPSIRFIDDDDAKESSDNDEEGQIDDKSPLFLKSDISNLETKFDGNAKKLEKSSAKKLKEKPSKPPSIITSSGKIIERIKTPKFLQDGEDDGDDEADDRDINKDKLGKKHADSCDPERGHKKNVTPVQGLKHTGETSADDDMPEEEQLSISRKQLQDELKELSFNDLPAKGQHLILNELIKLHSPLSQTAVIFSTLPAPSIGTHLDSQDSLDYTRNLALWLENLPPIVLVNSQMVTVTTDL
ncbi:uncharacterized protein PRCAT00002792001 [Priceomyces carsonii]|uniref:uncharacterized protein n=1 Tax=Priceomyces carsonii TaxID=28549 RepID=UPI002ED904F2|nr:unnamed protein product [Priceomyces carsonii]